MPVNKETYSSPVSVITIDCQFLQPGRAAAYLILEQDRAAFVDNGTTWAVPILLRTLKECGLQPEQVEYLILTHIHLDHAAGTSALLRACPNAVVLAHPRATRHLIDPSRIVFSAEKIHGKEILEAVYGPIEAVEAGRIRPIEDGERLPFGDRTLTFLHTPGHAKHHICIHDSQSQGIFTGDTFGVSHGPLRQSSPPCLLASCPPTDFDPVAARATIERIAATGAERAYLSHFGEYGPVPEGAAQLIQTLDRLEGILNEAVAHGPYGDQLETFLEGRVRMAAEEILMKNCGLSLSEEAWMELEPEIQMNARGLAHAVRKLILPDPGNRHPNYLPS